MKKRVAKKVLGNVLRDDLGGVFPVKPVEPSQVKSYRWPTMLTAMLRQNKAVALHDRYKKKRRKLWMEPSVHVVVWVKKEEDGKYVEMPSSVMDMTGLEKVADHVVARMRL